MSYASNTDVLQRMGGTLYVQLTDDTGAGVADELQVTSARVEAEAHVDSYLGRRYAVPVDAVGQESVRAVLRSVTLDLVEYRLHARRPPIPAEVGARNAAALAWLQGVAEGTLVLPAGEELAANESEAWRASSTGSPRVWGREDADAL